MSTLKEKLSTPAALLSFAACLCLPTLHLQAEPWVSAGDERTRHHLQILADSGKINVPLTTWPLMWSGVKKGLDVIRVEELSETELWSYRFLRHQLERSMRGAEANVALHAHTNPAYAFSDFSNDFREGHEARASLALNGDFFSLKVQGSYLNEPLYGQRARYDGSYAAITWSNWVLGAGAIDRWWGPAWSGSVVLGNNARPAPGLFLQRKDSSGGPGTLGSWNINVFISDPTDNNYDKDAKMAGGRLSYKPVRALEFSVSGTELFGSALLQTLEQDEAEDSEEAPETVEIKQNNRMLAFDWRLSQAFNKVQLALYHQISKRTAREQELNGDEQAELIGLEVGSVFAGLNSRLALEYQNTKNGELSIFDHSFYKSGYRYYGRNLATAIDTGSSAVSLCVDHYFESGHQLSWRLGNANLNEDNIDLKAPAGHPYGSESISVDYASVTYKVPVSKWVRADFGLQHLSESLEFAEEEISTGGQIIINIEF